jgi:c-di-GMP-binding flagellar brake protein YcgR
MLQMRSLKTATEQRRNPRIDCTGAAAVQFTPGEAPCPARIENLSAGGCLLVLQQPQELSQDTIVELTFKINDLRFRVWGQVRAIRSDTKIGFQFPLLSERVRRRIEDLIEQLIEDLLTRTALEGTGEQRRHPRIGCTGSAGVQLAAGEPFYPAKIVNLSAGGCLMVLQKPQRLAKDTMVELTFHINDLPFHVQGQVKAIRSDTRIGFQFPQLNNRVRRQLEDLVDELITNIVKRFKERTELN